MNDKNLSWISSQSEKVINTKNQKRHIIHSIFF